jgi:mannose-1-phosphate guanylyltransferase/mannose-6-phosphate isomerase
MLIKPVILCGGGGTRLWPISNARTPKQFLALSGPQSMLAQTASRVSDRSRFQRPLAIGSARHFKLLKEALHDADILMEPMARNSAPPIAAACLKVPADDLVLVMPADHHIADLAAFHRAIEIGAEAALNGRIVTFGIQPDHPATGYGYIKGHGEGPVRPVERFVEKPDLATARAYLAEGGFYWNAGIFLFRANVMLEAFKKHANDILEGVEASLGAASIDPALFADVRSESIDYAVLEHADNIEVVPVSMGWSDLGDFQALHVIASEQSGVDTIIRGPGAVTAGRRVYVHSETVPVAVHGLDDVAVIANQDGILVTRLSDAPGIKAAVAAAQDNAAYCATPKQRERLGQWLWETVLPQWARLAIDPRNGGFIEELDLKGGPILRATRRGRVAPRQLFSFARAKRSGWNKDFAADEIIEAALAFLQGAARSPSGGWAHKFGPDGEIVDARRDLYDHAFIALAASELAALGDRRGVALANEAFGTIDSFFWDGKNGGWHDPETGPGQKRANPHMHLLEASLAHFDATCDERSLERVDTICALFERWMFAPETGALLEDFNTDWSRSSQPRIEPGHCYEWAFLLGEVRLLTGRDTASWSRRLIAYAEAYGVSGGLVLDVVGDPSSHRLWPQLERLRALSTFPRLEVDLPVFLERLEIDYLSQGTDFGWVDRLDVKQAPASKTVPASMLYHLMTALGPMSAPPGSRKLVDVN